MHKLIRTSHGFVYSTLKNPRFLTPISHLHDTSKTLNRYSKLGFVVHEISELQSSKPINQIVQLDLKTSEVCGSDGSSQGKELTVQISHPWPEWVELIECLLKGGYLDGGGNPFLNGAKVDQDSNHIRTACLNFARDRYNLIRYLSRKDIHVIAGCGCPSLDRKVVNSGKRLRAHAGIEEGNVCSSCSLRGNCERAYVKAREEEGGRTVDVMRVLLTYGLDHLTGTVENKICRNKMVKESARRLLKEIVNCSTEDLDHDLPKAKGFGKNKSMRDHPSPREKHHINVPMKPGDWLCPKCNFLNFARNFKCLRCDELYQERIRQLREEQEHLPLKKGDWICYKCNFFNFAKNSRCLQCKEKPPKRILHPGEWECDSCNYINFRRNMVCLKCDYRRPKAQASEPSTQNVGSVEQNQNTVKGKWRFVEDESIDRDHSNTGYKVSSFEDFPIAGGKSELSRNAETRETWKREMLERSKDPPTTRRENDFDSNPLSDEGMFLECTDDEEMSDWFGNGKNQT